MSIVRLDDGKLKDYEQTASCDQCGANLLVMPPKHVRNKIDEGVKKDYISLIEAGLEWAQERYFYCKKCQKEYGRDEVEGDD